MSTLIEQLETLLNPLAAGGASYQFNEAAVPPDAYITFALVGGQANVSLNGRSAMQNERVQVDIFASRASDLESISAALDGVVDNGLTAAPGVSVLRLVPIGTAQDLFEDAVRRHRRIREFSVWWGDG